MVALAILFPVVVAAPASAITGTVFRVNESFEGSTFVPTDWTVTEISDGDDNTVDPDSWTRTDCPAPDPTVKCAYTTGHTSGSHRLETPTISTSGLPSPTLEFTLYVTDPTYSAGGGSPTSDASLIIVRRTSLGLDQYCQVYPVVDTYTSTLPNNCPSATVVDDSSNANKKSVVVALPSTASHSFGFSFSNPDFGNTAAQMWVDDVQIKATTVNTAPVANDVNVGSFNEGTKSVTLNGTDTDGDPLTYTIVTQPTQGTLSGTAPNLTYTSKDDTASSDSFTYKVNDTEADSAVGTVTLSPIPINDAPSASGPSVAVTDDQTNIVFSAANGNGITVADPDAGSDDIELFMSVPIGKGTLTLGSTPASLTVSQTHESRFTATGTVAEINSALDGLTFDPIAPLDEAISMSMELQDLGNNGTDSPNMTGTKTITITVGDVNTPPTAQSISLTTNEEQAISAQVDGMDLDSDTMTYSIVTQPAHGTVTESFVDSFPGLLELSLLYTPHADFFGTDSFTYKVNDGEADSDVGTVSITVTDVPEPFFAPLPHHDTLIVNEDEVGNITLQVSNPHPQMTWTVGMAAQGTTTASGPSVTYTPTKNFHGTDIFFFYVEAPRGDGTTYRSGLAQVNITVVPVNDPPETKDGEILIRPGETKDVLLEATDLDDDPLTDLDEDPLTYKITSPPIPSFYGKLTGTAPDLKFVADPQAFARGYPVSMIGDDIKVTYEVTDGEASATGTFMIKLRASQPDLTIQSDTDEFAYGNSVYNSTGAGQTSKVSLAFNEANVVKIEVTNAGTSTDDYLVRGTLPTGMTARYLDPSDTDITGAMQFTGYLMEDVAKGETRTIKAVLTPTDVALIGLKTSFTTSVASVEDPTRVDTVKAEVRLKPGIPDLVGAIKTEIIGEGRGGEVNLPRAKPGLSSFGRILLQNDGGSPADFLVKATKVFMPKGVAVTFRDDLGNDITSRLMGTGFEVKGLRPTKLASVSPVPIYVDVKVTDDVDGEQGWIQFNAAATDDPDATPEHLSLKIPVGASSKADVYVQSPARRGYGYRDPHGRGIREVHGQPNKQWASEYVDVGATRGKTFRYYVENTSKVAADFLLSVPTKSDVQGFGFTVTDYAGNDITSKVNAGTAEIRIGAGANEMVFLDTYFTKDTAADQFRSAYMTLRASPKDGGYDEADNFAFTLTPRTARPDVSVREEGGDTVGANVYSADPELQKALIDMKPNETRKLVFTIKNNSVYSDVFHLKVTGADKGFRISYTHNGAGFVEKSVELKAGESTEVKAQVTAPGASRLQLTLPVSVSATSIDSLVDPSPTDVATAAMNLGFASDLVIQKLSSQGNPVGAVAGDGVIDPVNPQVLNTTQGPLSKAKYRVTVKNTGVSRDSFILMWKRDLYLKEAHAYNATGSRYVSEPINEWIPVPGAGGTSGAVTPVIPAGGSYSWTIEVPLPPIQTIADKTTQRVDLKLISGLGAVPTTASNLSDTGAISISPSPDCEQMSGTMGTVQFAGDCMQRVDSVDRHGAAIKGWFSQETVTINGLDFTPEGAEDMLFINEVNRSLSAVRKTQTSLSQVGYVSVRFTGTDKEIGFGAMRGFSLGTAGTFRGATRASVWEDYRTCSRSDAAQRYAGYCDTYLLDNPLFSPPQWSVHGGLTYKPGTELVTITMAELGKSTVQVALAPPPAMSGRPQPITLGTDAGGLVAEKPKDVEFPILRFGSLGMADGRMTWDDTEQAWIGYARAGLPSFPAVPGIEGVFLVRGNTMFYCYIRMKLGLASIPLAPGVTLDELESQATQEGGFSTYGKITISALKTPVPGIEGKEISLLKLKGRYASTSLSDSDAKVSLQGQASLMGLLDFATFTVTFSGDGMRASGKWNYSVDLGSFAGISLGRLGITVDLEGGASGSAFQMTGTGKVHIFGQGPSLSAILSTKGVGGCASIDLPSPVPDVSAGVGISWSGSVIAKASGCSLDAYKVPGVPEHIDFAAIESRVQALLLKGDVTRQLMGEKFLAVTSALGK